MITHSQLTSFLSMHSGFRHEFGRLAEACRSPRDPAHEQLLEEQVALLVEMLHGHHVHEDDEVWPYLLSCAPDAAPQLEALEAEHEQLDPLIAAVSDTATPLTGRAEPLGRLHELLNAHLDHEERVAVPLMLEHLTPEMIEAHRRQAVSEMGRKRVPVIFGWLASCLDDELLAASLAENPRLVRLLFRRFWWPAYQRRMAALYGAGVRPVSTTLGGRQPVAS